MPILKWISAKIAKWFRNRWDDYNEDFKKFGGI